jgi:hypothetical protein
MKKWDKIQQVALGTHGIITFAQAKAMGVHPAEMYRWDAAGRLMKLNRGVFRLAAYPLKGFISDMAAIIATVGEGSYLYGESVLQLYDLCPTRSYVVTVATPRRIRRTTIPEGIKVVTSDPEYRPIYHEGIACQKIEDAIRSCIGVLETNRLEEAIDEAEEKGYFLPSEKESLKKEVSHVKTTA